MCFNYEGSSSKREQDEVIAEYKAVLDEAVKEKATTKADAKDRMDTITAGLRAGSFPPDTVRQATRLLRSDLDEIRQLRAATDQIEEAGRKVKSRKREMVTA